jgi:hypothetical protein
MDCFKRINKLESLEYINDLLIQLYEFKREKNRNKRLKSSRMKQSGMQPKEEPKWKWLWILKWAGIITVSGISIGALILKFFF